MKKILLTLFISLNFYPADLDREDIKEFIKMAEATSELTERKLLLFSKMQRPQRELLLQEVINQKLKQRGKDIEIDT